MGRAVKRENIYEKELTVNKFRQAFCPADFLCCASRNILPFYANFVHCGRSDALHIMKMVADHFLEYEITGGK